MQMDVHKTLYPFYPSYLCWLNLVSQSFVWNVFYTSAIRSAFSFHKLPNIHFFEHFQQISDNLGIFNGQNNMSGAKTRKLNTLAKLFQAMRRRIHTLTRLSENLLKLEHHAVFKNWADELRKLATADIALQLVLTKKSELYLSDKDVFPQACIDVF